MTHALPAEILSQAPLVWRRIGVGVKVKVRDPRWIKARMESMANQEAKKVNKLSIVAAIQEHTQPVEETWRPSDMNDEEFKKYAVGYCAAISARIIPTCQTGKITVNDIISYVAEKHKISIAEIKSKSRKVNIVPARHEVMWTARKICKLSLPMIGKLLGGIDHTSVLHGVNQHQKRLDTGEATRWN